MIGSVYDSLNRLEKIESITSGTDVIKRCRRCIQLPGPLLACGLRTSSGKLRRASRPVDFAPLGKARGRVFMRRAFLLIMFCMCVFIDCKAARSQKGQKSEDCTNQEMYKDIDDDIRRIRAGNKYGFVDKKGKTVIEPKFGWVSVFRDGIAKACVDCRVVDTRITGRQRWQRATVKSARGAWGYIDRSGKFIIPPRFDATRFFWDVIAAVEVNDKWGFIDKNGIYIIKPQFDSTRFPAEGTAAVKLGGKWGFIDKAGGFIANPQFDDTRFFSEGFAAVKTGDKWGFIDRKGNVIVKPRYDYCRHFSEGLAAVQIMGEGKTRSKRRGLGPSSQGKWGYVDKIGQCVIEPQFTRAGDFSMGLAPISLEDKSKRGYIDKDGKMIIRPQFDQAGDFNPKTGYARVRSGEDYWYIDKKGSFVKDAD